MLESALIVALKRKLMVCRREMFPRCCESSLQRKQTAQRGAKAEKCYRQTSLTTMSEKKEANVVPCHISTSNEDRLRGFTVAYKSQQINSNLCAFHKLTLRRWLFFTQQQSFVWETVPERLFACPVFKRRRIIQGLLDENADCQRRQTQVRKCKTLPSPLHKWKNKGSIWK